MVLGGGLLWSGAPETSPDGQADVVRAVTHILQQHNWLPPTQAEDQQQQQQPQHQYPPQVVIIYNDAHKLKLRIDQERAAAAQGGHVSLPVPLYALDSWWLTADPFRCVYIDVECLETQVLLVSSLS